MWPAKVVEGKEFALAMITQSDLTPTGVTMDDDCPTMLTVQDVASRLAISPSSVYKVIRSGVLPYYQFGGSIRVNARDLAAYIAGARLVATGRNNAVHPQRRRLKHFG